MTKKHLTRNAVSMEQPFMNNASQIARRMGVPATMIAQILYAGRARELAQALAESADCADARQLMAQAGAFQLSIRHHSDFSALVSDVSKAAQAD